MRCLLGEWFVLMKNLFLWRGEIWLQAVCAWLKFHLCNKSSRTGVSACVHRCVGVDRCDCGLQETMSAASLKKTCTQTVNHTEAKISLRALLCFSLTWLNDKWTKHISRTQTMYLSSLISMLRFCLSFFRKWWINKVGNGATLLPNSCLQVLEFKPLQKRWEQRRVSRICAVRNPF